jgi:methionyl-tRNA formyltransferase
MGKLKGIFMGTPESAVPALLEFNSLVDLKLVVTRKDKPKGRKRVLTPPPVKVAAQNLSIQVEQPEKIKNNNEFFSILKEINPDIILVVAYGKILPEKILNLPRFGCLNIHYSLLPKYRGAAPVNFALLNGEEETGVTIMKMDKGLDTGPVISSQSLKININDTAEYLLGKLSETSCKLLKNTLFKYVEGEIIPQKQNEENASYAPLMKKEDGLLDFNKNKLEVHNKIRAFSPWPGTYTYLNTKKFKIIKTVFDNISYKLEKPGTVIKHGKKVYVACKDGYLNIDTIQPESKKAMNATACLNGGYFKAGDCFGR